MNNIEQTIKNLKSKRDAFLGTKGEQARQDFKDGIDWAISSFEMLLQKECSVCRNILDENGECTACLMNFSNMMSH